MTTQLTAPVTKRTKVALLVCCPLLGGHEFQAAALARDLATHVDLTTYLNLADQSQLFAASEVRTDLLGQLLRPGTLPRQLLNGLVHRRDLRAALRGYDRIVVSAGAVEAGIAVALALQGLAPLSLYLPFFYDRVPLLGTLPGHAYNALLGLCCRLFSQVVTINRIQAKVILRFTGVPTMVVDNSIRPVAAPTAERPGRLVFIGRLGEQKRVGELLGWLDFPGNPFKEIMLIGDGPLRSSLEVQSRTLVHLRCEFHGWLDAAQQDALLSANDVLLINSQLEGEPLAIREANLRGMRVVSRDIVGVRGITLASMRYRGCAELRRLVQSLSTSLRRDQHRPPDPTLRTARRATQVARLAATWKRGPAC